MALPLLAFAFLGLASSTTTLDDMDKSSTVHSLMEETGLEQCRADAHAGNFHHDGATNKGQASFEFKFEVSQDGCYSLEEYHPGSDSKCSQLLTTNARLDIDWCVGRKSTVTFDQTKDGGMWNFVGIFPFFVGHPGALKMSNPAGLEGKHLVVDAFRVTRVADQCSGALQHQLWLESETRKQAASTAADTGPTPAPALTTTSGKYSWQTGSLQLTLQATPATGSEDLLASLKAQATTLEATLKSHLQARSVVVEDILQVDGRRLDGCRRLQALGESFNFDVRFKAEVPEARSITEPALSLELTTALAAVDAKLQVESIEFQWQETDAAPRDPAGEGAGSDTWLLTALFILGGLAVPVVLILAVRVACRKKKLAAVPVEVITIDVKEAQKELEEGQTEKTYDATDPPKKCLAQLDDNASTATPDSEPVINDVEVISVALETE